MSFYMRENQWKWKWKEGHDNQKFDNSRFKGIDLVEESKI